MTAIKLYKTPKKGLKIIFLCLLFLAFGLWMISDNPYGSFDFIMGWVGICFSTLGISIILFHIFDKRPQIIITENGIWDRTTKQDEIKWEQIIKAYPFSIFGQKFISIVTDDTFIFKKKPYKWAAKINKRMGVQNLNLQLGLITIDEIELTQFINQQISLSTEERRNSIERFEVDKNHLSIGDLKKILCYILISILILLLSLSSDSAFIAIMVIMGASALIARWEPANVTIRKYAEIGAVLGFLNLALSIGTTRIYDSITEDVAIQITIEIEDYKTQNASYPSEIAPITEKLDFNLIEYYIAKQIDYNPTDDDYELETKLLSGKRKKYSKNANEWR